MFNTINHHESNNVRIEQKPHDTADAARLYGEMRKAAEQEVVAAKIVQYGAMNALVIEDIFMNRDVTTDQKQYRILFSINGKQYDIRHTQSWQNELENTVAIAIVNTISKQLAL